MLALALILDGIFGEPNWLWNRIPHPSALMVRLVERVSAALNRGGGLRVKGVIALVVVVLPVWVVARVLSFDIFFGVFEVIGAAMLLAHRSLVDHIKAVADALGVSVRDGRDAAAAVVRHDVRHLDQSGIARRTIEAAAENFTEGVLAPAFWFLFFGLPGMALYKIVNTAAAMVGTAEHEQYGWAATRLDTVLTWLPARIAAVLLVLAGIRHRHGEEGGFVARYSRRFDTVMEEARRYPTPNAGWPEAAIALSLGIVLSASPPQTTDRQRDVSDFYASDLYASDEKGREFLTADDIRATVSMLWRSWVVLLAIVGIPALLLL